MTDELPVVLLADQASLPVRAHPDDAGLDLVSVEAATIPAGGRALLGTGFAIELPEGHAGLVLPRSGLAARHGITVLNSPGLIDAGYRGELKVLLHNTDPHEPFAVEPGDRIAQLVIVRVSDCVPVLARTLTASARGEGGYGSTGRR